jgi:hypothetical protein
MNFPAATKASCTSSRLGLTTTLGIISVAYSRNTGWAFVAAGKINKLQIL